ncbi:MAG: FxsA family protein [Pseudomonadota bacterium]
MWLLIAFIAVPLIEIALFIQIGGAIGLLWTLSVVVITAFVGAWLVKSQGMVTLMKLQTALSKMKDPTEQLVHGAMILFSGALLLTPGFFTDAIGFSLLVPKIRQFLFLEIRQRIQIRSVQNVQYGDRRAPEQRDDVIDGEFYEVPNEASENNPPSGWTRH